jgi:hypothetical protein
MNRKPFILQMFGSVSAILDTDEDSQYGDAHKVFIQLINGVFLKLMQYVMMQWHTEGGGLGGSTPPPKFRSFNKAEPNSQFHGKYIRNCLVFLFHHPN